MTTCLSSTHRLKKLSSIQDLFEWDDKTKHGEFEWMVQPESSEYQRPTSKNLAINFSRAWASKKSALNHPLTLVLSGACISGQEYSTTDLIQVGQFQNSSCWEIYSSKPYPGGEVRVE